jgi:hypothetical protein
MHYEFLFFSIDLVLCILYYDLLCIMRSISCLQGELYDSGISSSQQWQVELYKMTSQCFLLQFVVSYSPFLAL